MHPSRSIGSLLSREALLFRVILSAALSAALSVTLITAFLLSGCARPAPPVTSAIVDTTAGRDLQFTGRLDDVNTPSDSVSDVASGSDPDSQHLPDGAVSSTDVTQPSGADATLVAWLADGSCTPGAQMCVDVQLATCGSAGDGWSLSSCYPGQYCDVDHCVPIQNNLIIIFDTSGSMAQNVPAKSCSQPGFPACKPAQGCSRMDVSKTIFMQALTKVDTKVTRLALFRFPQRISRVTGATCEAGYYRGFPALSGDTVGNQSVATTSAWYWDNIDEISCVPYPSTETEAQLGHLQISRWMDGIETLNMSGQPCTSGGSTCVAHSACGKGMCCGQQCVNHAQPELRAHGGTPIGKTLFYVGEYLRHRVVVDGLPCTSTAGCASPNYRCDGGICTDRARSCRQTVVVLFTDGGQANDPTHFFAPRVAAQRLAYGLACKTTADCVGGSTCSQGRCLPASPSGFHCMATGAACSPGEQDPKKPLFCLPTAAKGGSCLPDLLSTTTAKAKNPDHNVLRSPNGRPFGVRVHVVDISDGLDLSLSHHLAQAGGGRLFTASSADPLAFVQALEGAFDMKYKKVCGTTQ